MSHSHGPDKTGVYFEGTKWTLQAHYPLLVDYVEESHDDRDSLMVSVRKHNDAGANVQTHEHKWVEMHIAYGWYPSPQKKAE